MRRDENSQARLTKETHLIAERNRLTEMNRRDLLQLTFLSGCGQAVLLPPLLYATGKSKTAIPVERIYGKIQFVNSFPDFKVKIVDSFADLHVQCVDSFPNAPGKWKIVNSFPDYRIQIVQSFPDFTVKYVESFPGVP